MKKASVLLAVALFVLVAGCDGGGGPTSASTPQSFPAQFALFATLNGLASAVGGCGDPNDLDWCVVDITLREVSGKTGGSINFLRVTGSRVKEFGTAAFINKFGTNRVEAGSQLQFTVIVKNMGRPKQVLVQITDDTGKQHNLQTRVE